MSKKNSFYFWNLTKNLNVSLIKMKIIVRKIGVDEHNFQNLKTKNQMVIKWSCSNSISTSNHHELD